MAWRRPGDKPLSESMFVRFTTHICVTRPQRVKSNLTVTHNDMMSVWMMRAKICEVSDNDAARLVFQRGCKVCRYHMWRVGRGQGPIYYSLTLKLAWISNHIPTKAWLNLAHPFQNFNGCAFEVWEWISNFIPQFIMDVITYPCWVKVNPC